MSAIRTAAKYMIIGTAAALIASPVMAQEQSLGTLPTSEVNQINQNSATYSAPLPTANLPAKSAAFKADPGSAATYTSAQAVPDTSVLQPTQVGDISYVTGGIGDEEIAALDSAKKDYNLHVMSASANGGAFKGNTQITIRNKKGDQLVTTDAGPIFLAKLPAGSYVVEATNGGVTKRQNVTVGGKKLAHAHFGF